MPGKATKNRTKTTREEILETAVVLFARKGYGRTGLRELAREAGVNLAMINYFFGSKKKLLIELLDLFFSGYLKLVTTELAGQDSVPVKLERFILSAIAYFESNRDSLIVAITDLHHDDPEIIKHKAGWGRQTIAVLDREICRPLASESGTSLPPTLVASLLMSMMASRYLFSPVLVHLEQDGNDIPDLEQYGATLTGLFWGGLSGLGESTRRGPRMPGQTHISNSQEGEK